MKAVRVEVSESEYDDMLREVFGNRQGEVEIAGNSYDVAYALKEVDPTAYRVGFSDFESEHEGWKCSECDTVHETEEEAEECCKDEGK